MFKKSEIKENMTIFSHFSLLHTSVFYRVVAIISFLSMLFMCALHYFEVKAENEEKSSQTHAALGAFFISIENTLTHLDQRKEASKDTLHNINSVPYDIPHEYKIKKLSHKAGRLDGKLFLTKGDAQLVLDAPAFEKHFGIKKSQIFKGQKDKIKNAQNSIKIWDRFFLFFSVEEKEYIRSFFLEKGFWMIVVSVLGTVLCLITTCVHLNAVFRVRSSFKERLQRISNLLETLKKENTLLLLEKEVIEGHFLCMKKKDSFGKTVMDFLEKSRTHKMEKISSMVNVLEYALVQGCSLDNNQVRFLMPELQRTLKRVSVIDSCLVLRESVYLADVIKNVQDYLMWDLTQKEISLEIDNDTPADFSMKSDSQMLEIYLVCILQSVLSRCFKGGTLVLKAVLVKQELCLYILRKGGKSLEEGLFENESFFKGGVLSQQDLEALAYNLEVTLSHNKNETTLLFQTQKVLKSTTYHKGIDANVIPLFA